MSTKDRARNLSRRTPLAAKTPLSPGTSQLQRAGYMTRSVALSSPAACITASRAGIFPAAGSPVPPRKRIRPVSPSRAKANRERKALAKALYPETPRCAVPWCPLEADDIHETLTRARSGGSITDPDLWAPACRGHNHELTLEPKWGYDLRLLWHSGSSKDEPPAGAMTREAAGLLFGRDLWCVHCGNGKSLRPWLRQEYGEHAGCACGWVLLCPRCRDRAAADLSGEMAEEGLIIAERAVKPYTVPVVVHLEADRGGMHQWPLCDGSWSWAPVLVTS